MTTEPQVMIPGAKEMTQEGLAEMVRKSVQVPLEVKNSPFGLGLIWALGQFADSIPEWGTDVYRRDVMLRRFFGSESFTTSAISTIIARNMGFGFALTADASIAEDSIPGPMNDPTDVLVSQMQNVLNNADFSRGWKSFIGKVSLDLYTQDRGAFIEIVREAERPDAAVIGLNHLDSLRCWQTGDPFKPVLYVDRRGTWHEMDWFSVIPLTEIPATSELAYGMGYSALSRILKAAQIFKNIAQYQEEKTGGRHSRAVHLVSGVAKEEIDAALQSRMIVSDNQGLSRYMQPAIAATIDPKADPKLVTIELAGLPDAWDMAEMFKWFTTIVALGLLSDYGDFAPLPGGNLGTAAQSETMYERSKAKGAELFKGLIQHSLNDRGVMPKGVEFEFVDLDLKGATDEAIVVKARADARAIMIANGEIDAEGSAKMAVEAGDIPQDIYDESRARLVQTSADETERDRLAALAQVNQLPNANAFKARTELPSLDGVGPARVDFEDEFADALLPALDRVRLAVNRKLRSLV